MLKDPVFLTIYCSQTLGKLLRFKLMAVKRMDSFLFQRHENETERKVSRLGFELELPIPCPKTITLTVN